MSPELEAAEADERQGIVGQQPAGRLERGLGHGVERGVGGLADALEQRQAELELRVAVVGSSATRAAKNSIKSWVGGVVGGGASAGSALGTGSAVGAGVGPDVAGAHRTPVR